MYVVVACENRRIFRLLLCCDLPFLRFKIFAFLLNFSTSGLYFSNSAVKLNKLLSRLACHRQIPDECYWLRLSTQTAASTLVAFCINGTEIKLTFLKHFEFVLRHWNEVLTE